IRHSAAGLRRILRMNSHFHMPGIHVGPARPADARRWRPAALQPAARNLPAAVYSVADADWRAPTSGRLPTWRPHFPERLLPAFLHTADWQIGKLYGQFEADEAALLAEERFAAVERLAALAARHDVAAVLVAGDVFDAQGVADRTIHKL